MQPKSMSCFCSKKLCFFELSSMKRVKEYAQAISECGYNTFRQTNNLAWITFPNIFGHEIWLSYGTVIAHFYFQWICIICLKSKLFHSSIFQQSSHGLDFLLDFPQMSMIDLRTQVLLKFLYPLNLNLTSQISTERYSLFDS